MQVANLIEKIDHKPLLDHASKLLNRGTLESTDNMYHYLNVVDEFILELFPLIQEKDVVIPDYFPPHSDIGAHLSVFYPNELNPLNEGNEGNGLNEFNERIVPINVTEKGQSFSFEVKNLIKMHAFDKTYYALMVFSKDLEALRIKYGFNKMLNFKGVMVPFHITIGKRNY